MDRVGPALARLEVPQLSGVLSRERADGLVEDLAVHRPGTALTVERPVPLLGDLDVRARKLEERDRNLAVIVHRVVHDPEFDDVVRSDELARGATAIGLLQAILEVDPAPRLRLGEVDDDVDALCHCDADTVLDERAGQQVAVGAEPVERLPVAQGELQKARGPADQEPEAILPALDVQIRLDLRIHRHLVAQDPVQVEQVEEELAGGRIEHLVHEEIGVSNSPLGRRSPVVSSSVSSRMSLLKSVQKEASILYVFCAVKSTSWS